MCLGLLSPLLLLTNSSSKHWCGQFRRWIDSSLVQLSCNHWANEGAWWAAVSSWRAANTTIMPSLGGRTYGHVLNEKALHKSDSGLEWKQQLRFWSLCFFAQSCDVTQSIWKENCVCSFPRLRLATGRLAGSVSVSGCLLFRPAEALEAWGWQLFLDFFSKS